MTPTPVAGVGYWYDSASRQWVAPGRPSLSGVLDIPREQLVYGTYIPGTLRDAALGIVGVNTSSVGCTSPDGDLEPVTGTDGVFTVDASTPAELFEGRHFQSAVAIAAGLNGPRTFRNCRFSGNNPMISFARWAADGSLPVGFGSAFRNWTSRHITLVDCTFDAGWWFDQGLSDYEAWQHSAAILGGHVTVERSILEGFTDGVNFTGAPGNADGRQFVKILASRLGPNYYAYGLPTSFAPQAGQYTHSDGFQWNTGAKVEIAYSYIGGPRRYGARPVWPGGTQMGDAANAGLMIQQEPDSRYDEAQRRVDDIWVHDNWIAGGSSSVNLNFSQGNALPAPGLVEGYAGTRVVDNRIMSRIPGFNDSGYQIRYRTEMRSDVSRNVEWDPFGSLRGTGAPVLVHEVANSGSGDSVVRTWFSPMTGA